MLSIGKLGQGQADYYLQSVAQGVEDYYTGAGEAPGRWLGSAAAELEVSGEVEAPGLHSALDGAHPDKGNRLAERRGGTRVPGFDLTFRAPKSVSVLFGLAAPELSAQIRDAHEAAVDAALDYMERNAAVARRGPGGAENVLGNGFVAAAFRHRTSRAGDPQLHTHVLVANMTRGPDGRWTALDARWLYAHAKTGGFLYQAQLRTELTRRLGVEWTAVRNGTAEVVGIPTSVLRAFSRRRAEIEQTMADRGERSARAAQVAALDTRRAKDYGVSHESLVEGWWDRAQRLGLEREQLAATIGRTQTKDLDPEWMESTSDELASPNGLTRQRSTFTRRDVIQGFCEQLCEGGEVVTVETLADGFLASGRTIALAQDVRALTHSDVIRRADGRMVAATADERRHSTPELLATERRLIDTALARRVGRVAVVESATVDAVLRRRPILGEEQAQMVRRLTRSGDGVQVVTGKAGAGKTFALDAAREAWETQGHRVIGTAVARRAAKELEDGAGIESTSLAALLADLRDRRAGGLAPRSVVVIDEASMAGTRQLAELLDHAHTADAKVVLVGDPRQLPEIDAGGSFRALMTRLDPIELAENRRQRAAWERDALDQLREGRPDEAIDQYQRHGRVFLAEDAEQVRQQLVRDWFEAHRRGDAVMVAARRDDVADLNRRARALKRASTELGPDTLTVAGRDLAVGDEVVLLKNAPRLAVTNGTRGTVNSIDAPSAALVLRTTDGRDIHLPASYLLATTRHGGPTIDHGYALTGHKAQGMTTRRAFVLGSDDLYREWGYVAMSRGRDDNRIYVVAPTDRGREEYAPREQRREPLDALIAALRRSEAQTAALDITAQHGIRTTPTHQLVRERSRLARELGELVPTKDGGELRRLTGQRNQAERAVDEARQRIAELETRPTSFRTHTELAAERALEAQARERVRDLADRERRLLAGARRGRLAPANRSETIARYAAIEEELDRRHRSAGRATAVEQPGYLTAELGPYPDRPSQRRAWARAATRIGMYRQQYGVDDPARALGPEPQAVRQRSAWRDAQRDIERARRQLIRDADVRRTPDRGRQLA